MHRTSGLPGADVSDIIESDMNFVQISQYAVQMKGMGF